MSLAVAVPGLPERDFWRRRLGRLRRLGERLLDLTRAMAVSLLLAPSRASRAVRSSAAPIAIFTVRRFPFRQHSPWIMNVFRRAPTTRKKPFRSVSRTRYRSPQQGQPFDIAVCQVARWSSMVCVRESAQAPEQALRRVLGRG